MQKRIDKILFTGISSKKKPEFYMAADLLFRFKQNWFKLFNARGNEYKCVRKKMSVEVLCFMISKSEMYLMRFIIQL